MGGGGPNGEAHIPVEGMIREAIRVPMITIKRTVELRIVSHDLLRYTFWLIISN